LVNISVRAAFHDLHDVARRESIRFPRISNVSVPPHGDIRAR
jgi:hypothetical protein